MSIVERALEKAQRRRAADAPAGARPVAAAEPNIAASFAALPSAPVQAAGERELTPEKAIAIDYGHLRAEGVLPPPASERRLAEEFRRIKRPLVARALGTEAPNNHRTRLIMVASALPGEGKTFTSFNLALSLAREKDVHVLLIDADVAKPQISELLGMVGAPGLLDLLREAPVGTRDVIYGTDVPGLNVMPAGSRSETDTELLASRRMNELMSELINDDPRRVVVLDSPPLLLTNESRELAQAAGQIVLVVRAGVTPHRAVFEAIEAIGDSRPIGLVLNQTEAIGGAYGYRGYAGYDSYGDADSSSMK